MNKSLIKWAAIGIMALLPHVLYAQIDVKLNALYAAVGVLNPQVEFHLTDHSSTAVDLTFSPWKSVNGKHAQFGILQAEYRYYTRPASKGFYISGHLGSMMFDLTRPYFFQSGKFITFEEGFGRGFGVMIGVGVGYTYHFGKRWLFDAFFAFDRMWSWYNDYDSEGRINMYPGHQHEPKYPDPFNGSAEWLPSKIGFSIGYRIFPGKR
ncbi:MAG: DUF3575 domain-containing protein [Alistipes sp.]|nr:DUF3575 domain-containing protein [Alistipes sp.]